MWRWITATLSLGLATGLLWWIQFRNVPEEQYRLALKLLRNGDFGGAAEKAARELRRNKTSEWRSRFGLLQTEALLENGQGESAAGLLNSMTDLGLVEHRVRYRVLRARLLMSKAALSDAQRLLVEARHLAAKERRTDLEAEVELLLGLTFGRQRRVSEAETAFLAARKAAVAASDPYRLGGAANNLGMIRMIRSRCDEAIPLFEEAQNLYREAEANHWVAAVRNNIAVCYSQLGDIDNAFTYRQAALGLSRPSALKANALGETGTVLLTENPAKAVAYYQQARDMARQFGALPDAARWAGNLASALAASNQWDAAEAALQDARQLGPEPRSRVFLDLNAASIALGRGRAKDARAIYENAIEASPDTPTVLWQAHAGIAATWMAENDPAKAGRSFESAIRVVEQAQSDLNRNEHKLTFLARLIRLYQDYVDVLMSRDETVRALAVVDRSRARLLAERISRQINLDDGLSAKKFCAIAEKGDSTWLAYWIAPKRSFLWAVTAKEVRVFHLPGEEEITTLVREYRRFIENGLRDPLRTPSEAGRRLYQILISPAASLIRPGSRVIVVPDGALHQLSFDTLPVYDDQQRGYFMDHATVALTPSFSLFDNIPGNREASRDALIIGDPISPAPAFPALQHAGREITSVASHMSSVQTVVVRGQEARPEVWKTSNPGGFSTIHIAAHAEANERSPLDSAIILSPGSGYRLYARDIIDVPLRARLVSLSACRSSGSRTYAGEGLVGFAWAFLHAGAKSVIAGLWDVADESTLLMMDHLYSRIAAGEPPMQALHSARLALRKTAYSKPFYWGAFQLYLR